MSDFYVQLLSNASTAEFPSNRPNHFKNRMPYPLQFREPGWKVGMNAVSARNTYTTTSPSFPDLWTGRSTLSNQVGYEVFGQMGFCGGESLDV